MITTRKKTQILKRAMQVAAAFQVFKKESQKMESLIDPLLKSAIKTKNKKMIEELIDLTCAIDKKGKYIGSGDYIGRFYLFQASVAIKKR